MARFLITMLPANDLGLPTRMVPIARALADRGHEVAVFNPAPAPSRLIAEAGLTNLPMPVRPMPAPAFDLTMVAEGWDVEHFFAGLYTSEIEGRNAGGDHSHDQGAGKQCASARIVRCGRSGDADRRRGWREAGGCGRVRHEGEARAERALLSSIRQSALPNPCVTSAAPRPPQSESKRACSLNERKVAESLMTSWSVLCVYHQPGA
jgi:hypothetical protein